MVKADLESMVAPIIKSKLDWQRLTTIYNDRSSRMTELVETHGVFGVYTACRTEHKSDDLISPNPFTLGPITPNHI